MGIKLFAFVRRAHDMSPAEFHAYWRDEHAAHIAGTPELRRHLQRYELNHRIADDYGRAPSDGEMATVDFDGVAVMWFASRDAYDAFRAEPGFADWLAEDGERFRRPPSELVLTGDEIEIVDASRRGEAGLKLVCAVGRRAGWEDDAYFTHWREHHGGLFRNVAELREPLLGYHQNHGIEGRDAAFDGVTEQWFVDLPTWIESLTVPAHHDLVEPDVASFLDPDRIRFVLAGRPTVMVGE